MPINNTQINFSIPLSSLFATALSFLFLPTPKESLFRPKTLLGSGLTKWRYDGCDDEIGMTDGYDDEIRDTATSVAPARLQDCDWRR